MSTNPQGNVHTRRRYVQDPSGAAGDGMPTVVLHDLFVIAVNTASTHIASSSTTAC